MPRSWTTGGAPLSRWATKNAPNVAPISSAKTMRASQVTGGATAGRVAGSSPSGRLVLAEDHDDIRVLAQVARVGVHRLHGRDVEPVGDGAGLRARPGARAVHDRRVPALLVGVVAGRDLAGVARRAQLVRLRR